MALPVTVYELPAASVLLAAESPVFKRMFSSGFRESQGEKRAEIRLHPSGKTLVAAHLSIKLHQNGTRALCLWNQASALSSWLC